MPGHRVAQAVTEALAVTQAGTWTTPRQLIAAASLVTGFMIAVLLRTRRDVRDTKGRLATLRAKRWSDAEGLVYAALILVVVLALIGT